MAETSIAKARRLAKEKREKQEAEDAAAAAAEAESKKPVEKPASSSLLDKIRDAFSSDDDINRIDEAVDAVTTGVKQADKDSKRKRKA